MATIGEKIKARRRELHITQSSLSGGQITRNMLSLIETGRAMPSLETAAYLAKELKLPLAYLLSDELRLFFFEKEKEIGNIKRLFTEKRYFECISLIETMSEYDDELYYILARAHFEYGKNLTRQGSLYSAAKQLTSALQLTDKTCYVTKDIELIAPLYLAVATNIASPALEFESEEVHNGVVHSEDYEFFKYSVDDYAFEYKNPLFKKHKEAKSLERRHSYKEAIALLLELEETKNSKECYASVLFKVYTDLEYCYKQLGDFENAYKYCSKRISLLEGFKL